MEKNRVVKIRKTCICCGKTQEIFFLREMFAPNARLFSGRSGK
jgi:hypothetical protein